MTRGWSGFDEPFLTLRNQGSLLAMTPGRRPSAANESNGGEVEGKIIDWIVLKPEEREAFPERSGDLALGPNVQIQGQRRDSG